VQKASLRIGIELGAKHAQGIVPQKS